MSYYLKQMCATAVLGLCGLAAAASTTHLTGLELRSGSRGLAVVIDGDGDFAADARVATGAKNGGSQTVTISLSQAAVGFKLRHFTDFPAGCPVTDIAIKEKTALVVDIVLSLDVAADSKPIVKNKETRQLVLISSRRCAESEWFSASVRELAPQSTARRGNDMAQPAVVSHDNDVAPSRDAPPKAATRPVISPVSESVALKTAPAPETKKPAVEQPVAAASEAKSILRDIAVFERGDLAQVDLTISGPFTFDLKTASLQLTLKLHHVSSELESALYKIANSPVSKIDIKESKSKGSGECIVTIALEPGTPSGVYAVTAPPGLIIVMPRSAKPRFVAWSAAQNRQVSAEWAVEPPAAPGAGIASSAKKSITPSAPFHENAPSVIPTVRAAAAAASSARSEAAPAPVPTDSAAPRSSSVDSVKYTAYGRDPFMPYAMENDPTLPSVDNLKLVGVLYSGSDRIALLQDRSDAKHSFALRELDLVKDGSVMRINRTNVIFLLTEMGISRTFSLELPGDNTIVKSN